MSEERGEYIVDGSESEDDGKSVRVVNDVILKTISHPATPPWTHRILTETAKAESTYPLVHLREDVRLLLRIMEGGNHEKVELWIGEDLIPGWMRLVLATFLEEESRFARQRMIADAEVVEDIITIKCGFD